METMPVMEVTTFSGSHLLYQKLFVLVENALIIRNYSFQWKPLLLVEAIGLWQYSFHLVETVPFNGRHFLRCPENFPQGKLPPGQGQGLVQDQRQNQGWGVIFLGGSFSRTISLNGSYSFYWKPSILVKTIPFSGSHFPQLNPFLLGKAFAFLGNHCSIFFLMAAAPFNRNFSFQWKPFFLVFQHFHQKLD